MGGESLATKSGFIKVNVIQKSVVKPTSALQEPEILTLSNLDLLSGRFPLTYLNFYRRLAGEASFASIVESLKSSLAETLNYFYPFAGRIIFNPRTGEPEILCDGSGVLVLEAHASVALKEVDFYDVDQYIQGKLVDVDTSFPVQVQITKYMCEGISLTFSFDHALGDASAFSKFLVSWCEISRNVPVSCAPNHKRTSIIRARSPPTYHPSLDQAFVKCTMEEIVNIPTPKTLLKRLYHVDIGGIGHLQKLACADGPRRTKIEAFSAYLWKMMVGAVDLKSYTACNMAWLVDGRGRMVGGESDPTSDFIGNVLSVAVEEASIEELRNGTVANLASKIHEAICKVTNRSHFLDLIDWIECHRPGLMLSRAVLGQRGPTLVVSSGRRFPIKEMDFGFGTPILGTFCTTVDRIAVAYMNQRPSARGDGSWVISAIVWPELAAVLESDGIFQPMSTRYLPF